MSGERMSIYCCTCEADVSARLTSGEEVYPHRKDLASLPFWRCDACECFVGCHHKTKERTKPLGCIPSREIKSARSHIHRILDPIWKSGRMPRRDVYNAIAEKMGIPEYHTAELRTLEDARAVYAHVVDIRKSLGMTRRTGMKRRGAA